MPKVIIIIWILLVLAIWITLFLSFRKKAKDQNQYSIFLKNKTSNSNAVVRYSYEFFTHWIVTRRFMLRIRRKHEIIFPGDNLKIVKGTMKIMFSIIVIFVFSIIFLITQKFSFYGNCIFLITIYFTVNEVVYLMLETKHVRLLVGLDKFIGDVRHYYFEHEMVDEAVDSAIDDADTMMRLHGKKLYDVLVSPDQDGEIINYNETMPNRFLRTFLANCTMVMKYGDTKKDGESLYLSNLKDLKRELAIETLKRQKNNVIFSGMTFMCIIPLYVMPIAQAWCINNFPIVEKYFTGSLGILSQIVAFIAALLSYNLIRRMKDDTVENIMDHPVLDYLISNRRINNFLEAITSINYSRTLRLQILLRRTGENLSAKKFYLKRILFGIMVFFLAVGILFYGHELDKKNLINKVTIDEGASSSFIASDYEAIVPTATIYIKEDLSRGMNLEEITEQVFESGSFRNIDAASYTGGLIYKQIQKYHDEYFKWYDLLIALFASVIGYFVPIVLLKSKEKTLKMQMDDEVIQFQSVILMLIHLDRITVETILEWMSDFAIIFKPSIQECLDNYANGDKEALEKLAEDEPYPSFQRIIKNLIACDRIGIEPAFNEISVDRINYQETRKQENEIMITKKAANASIVSFITFYTVIALYLVAPVVYGAISKLSDISSVFNQ